MKRTRELTPDVVLLDLDLPGLSGLTVAELLRDGNVTCDGGGEERPRRESGGGGG